MSHILVIDDEYRFRATVVKILRNAGYEVHEANNGADGIRAIRDNHPALVITDIVMPDKEGIETIRDLRRQHPELPIIAMSGYTQNSNFYLEMAGKLGATAWLSKPFPSDELLTQVRRCLAA